jgi:hypothetical protein
MSFKIIKELLKTSNNGQWQLLRKAFVNQSIPKHACNCGAQHTAAPNMHYDWCDGLQDPLKLAREKSKKDISNALDKYVQAGDSGDLHDILSKAPKGSVDFGDIFRRAKNDPSEKIKKLVRSSDFMDHLNRHLDGVKDMKDIHDNHGGLDAVEGVLKHYHGSNGVPSEYNGLNFGKNNKKIHAEAMDLVWPGKGTFEYDDQNPDPRDRPNYGGHIDPAINDEVIDAHNKATGGDNFDEQAFKAHGRAAIKRAMDAFRKYHKL